MKKMFHLKALSWSCFVQEQKIFYKFSKLILTYVFCSWLQRVTYARATFFLSPFLSRSSPVFLFYPVIQYCTYLLICYLHTFRAYIRWRMMKFWINSLTRHQHQNYLSAHAFNLPVALFPWSQIEWRWIEYCCMLERSSEWIWNFIRHFISFLVVTNLRQREILARNMHKKIMNKIFQNFFVSTQLFFRKFDPFSKKMWSPAV